MSTQDHMAREPLDNQTFALMGRLHVALRRGGRVTDIEYMRIDPTYCRHVLALVAASDNDELRDMGLTLEAFFFGENGIFMHKPGLQETHEGKPALLAGGPGGNGTPPASDPTQPVSSPGPYVGRLR